PARDWELRVLRFRGRHAISAADLRKAMVTKPRTLLAVWRAYPAFDPIAFRTDIERLRQLYRNHGYYHAQITYDLELPAKGNALTAVVYIEEGPPVVVDSVEVTLAGEPLPPAEERRLREHVPIARGAVFTDQLYTRGETYLR